MVNSRFRVWKQSAGGCVEFQLRIELVPRAGGKDCSIINEIFDRLHAPFSASALNMCLEKMRFS